MEEEAPQQYINEHSKLELFEFLSDHDIVSHVTSGSEETKYFEECLEGEVENLLTHNKYISTH